MGRQPRSVTDPRRLEPRLTVRAIRPLVSGVRECGHDAAPILATAGIDAATLDDPDGWVPTSVAITLLTHAVEITGDTNLGLHLAERAELGSFDVHFYAMASSPTLGAAYERLCRYQRLIHETSRVELEIEDDRAKLRHHFAWGAAAPRQTAEYLLTAWVRAGRVVTGVDWNPQEVHFVHAAPLDASEHVRFFRADVHFGMGENALVLPAPLLQTRCARADPALVAVLDRYAADRLERVPDTNSIVDRVRNVLGDELRGGEPTAAGLAARLKMSPRTLHRALPVVFSIHALAGAMVLLIGPLQSLRWIRSRARLRRALGRSYVVGVWIASLTAAVDALWFDVSTPAKVMFISVAALWFATTTIGMLRARARRAAEKHEWMVRSYSLSLFFVTFSLWVPALANTSLPVAVAYPMALFLSGSLNLAIADLWIRRTRRRPSVAMATASGPIATTGRPVTTG